MPFQTPSAIKVGGETAKTTQSPALLFVSGTFLTAYVGEGGSKLYCSIGTLAGGGVKWDGNKQITTTGGHKLETHRSPGIYYSLLGASVGIVFISTDQTSINQTSSPYRNFVWADPEPLSDFNSQRVKWDQVFVSTCGWQTFVIAVDVHGGVWFSAQATWFDAFSGNYGTTSWTKAQKIAFQNIEIQPGSVVNKFDSWTTGVCTANNQQFTALYGVTPHGIAIFKVGQENINESTNQLTIGKWSFQRSIPFAIPCATACTEGTGAGKSHRLFFIDTTPGGLLSVDVNPGESSFFENQTVALKPGDKFSTDHNPAATYFSLGSSGPFGYALVWKHSSDHDLFFSSELL